MKLIKNALIYDEHISSKNIVNILYDSAIVGISSSPIAKEVSEVIDLKGKSLIPGCIDAHVHFNDPGYDHHEDFLTGTSAAAYGGITTVIDMPCTSIPPVTSLENLEKKLAVISRKALVDFALWGGIRRNDQPISKDKLQELWEAGVVGFKIYTISGMDSFAALSYQEIEEILNTNPEFLFAFHAEDEKVIFQAKAEIEDKTKPENYVRSRPVAAELKAVKNIIASAAPANKIHFVHISSRKAAEHILKEKKNKDISLETCPHYLQFTSDDFPRLKGKLKTAPPVKFAEDRTFLREILQNGKLDYVATDHAGCNWKSEKELEDFSKVYNGIPGTQLLVPYLFSEFYLKEKTTLKRMIEITSENAARRFGFYPQKGSLKIGTDADFTVIDLEKPLAVNEQKLMSKGRYSPFEGEVFSCSVNKTIVRGKTVFDVEKGVIAEAGYGKFTKKFW